jgi:hypothetical protein
MSAVIEDFLDEDAEIAGQRYVLMSFISPEKVLEKKDLYFFHKFLDSYEVNWKLKNLEKYMVDVVKNINDQLDDRQNRRRRPLRNRHRLAPQRQLGPARHPI